MIQDNMDFLYENEERHCGSDYNIDSEKDIEYISIPAWRMVEEEIYYPDNTDCDHISCWDRDQSEQDVDGFID